MGVGQGGIGPQMLPGPHNIFDDEEMAEVYGLY